MDRYFTGKFEFSIDSKGRVSVPAKFRDLLDADTNFHIIRVPKFSLRIYPEAEWEKKARIYANLPETPEFHEYTRIFYNSQADSDLDPQGRITIPKRQLEQIKYNGGKLVFLGMGKYIEVFCAENENAKIEDDDDEKLFAENYYKIEEKIREFEEK